MFDDVTLYGRDDEMDDYGESSYDDNLDEMYDEEEEEEEEAGGAEPMESVSVTPAQDEAPEQEAPPAAPPKPKKPAKKAAKKAKK